MTTTTNTWTRYQDINAADPDFGSFRSDGKAHCFGVTERPWRPAFIRAHVRVLNSAWGDAQWEERQFGATELTEAQTWCDEMTKNLG